MKRSKVGILSLTVAGGLFLAVAAFAAQPRGTFSFNAQYSSAVGNGLGLAINNIKYEGHEVLANGTFENFGNFLCEKLGFDRGFITDLRGSFSSKNKPTAVTLKRDGVVAPLSADQWYDRIDRLWCYINPE